MADAGEEWTVVPVAEVRTFIKRCAEVAGADPGQADSLADVLTTADQRGHYSHGINRLGKVQRRSQVSLVGGGADRIPGGE